MSLSKEELPQKGARDPYSKTAIHSGDLVSWSDVLFLGMGPGTFFSFLAVAGRRRVVGKKSVVRVDRTLRPVKPIFKCTTYKFVFRRLDCS